jgi:hypothetical protein
VAAASNDVPQPLAYSSMRSCFSCDAKKWSATAFAPQEAAD